jgi:23S rRNA pseudouridine1911/1915/1917 synthase
MSYIGHPVAGDPLYGTGGQTLHIHVLENGCSKTCPVQLKGQVLHARLLGLIHPSTGKYMEWEASLPQYFEDLLKLLRTQ